MASGAVAPARSVPAAIVVVDDDAAAEPESSEPLASTQITTPMKATNTTPMIAGMLTFHRSPGNGWDGPNRGSVIREVCQPRPAKGGRRVLTHYHSNVMESCPTPGASTVAIECSSLSTMIE